jgi:hypothetical protein
MRPMRLTRKVAEEAEKVTQEDIDKLRDLGFSDDDIFSVILAAAAQCFFSKVPDQLRSVLTVGRPIASSP